MCKVYLREYRDMQEHTWTNSGILGQAGKTWEDKGMHGKQSENMGRQRNIWDDKRIHGKTREYMGRHGEYIGRQGNI